jgi:DNA repair protein RadD
VCPNCEVEAMVGQPECYECGWIFAREKDPHHDTHADDSQILSTPEKWLVEAVEYRLHVKRNAEPGDCPTLRVDYECTKSGSSGNLSREVISEWVCVEHEGFAQRKAMQWWVKRSKASMPATVDEAVDLCHRGAVAAPRSIMVAKQGRFWRVLSAELDEIPDEWSDAVEADPFEVDEGIPF